MPEDAHWPPPALRNGLVSTFCYRLQMLSMGAGEKSLRDERSVRATGPEGYEEEQVAGRAGVRALTPF